MPFRKPQAGKCFGTSVHGPARAFVSGWCGSSDRLACTRVAIRRGDRDGMKKVVLRVILLLARVLGLFAISRRMTRRDLRILCYHGGALADEHRFSPGLFMSESTFARRMQFLAEGGYHVLRLDEALRALRCGDLPDFATVITVDDGWYGSIRVMVPTLARHGFPATLYVATYYVEKQTQVFNVAVGYVLWKAAGMRRLDVSVVSPALSGTFDLSDSAQRQGARNLIVAYGEGLDSAAARQDLLMRLCEHLGIGWAAIRDKRLIAFATGNELRELPAKGIDVQCHTHRHRFPVNDPLAASKEIDDNRHSLATCVPGPFEHFCYPSGVYAPDQFELLRGKGIRSATCTRSGFTRVPDRSYELTRFLDSEAVTPLEFEAEMSGFFEIIRRLGYAI